MLSEIAYFLECVSFDTKLHEFYNEHRLKAISVKYGHILAQ